MKKRLENLLLVCLLILPVCLFAQSETVTGTVNDAALGKGSGMPGVTVMIKGTQQGTVTDQTGKFSIKVKQGQTLVFSYIGYKTVEIEVGSKTTINVSMTEDMEELESVVVVGYGVQKKASTVGSIATTRGEDLLKTGGVTTISEALQGQMAGVVAINSTSKPGADAADIFIRGKGTWRDASPLILVDGIERNINNIDANEIESISVLKDASATAVYGVKGANGVILLTTKRGKKKAAEVNFSANLGFKSPSSKLKWADYITSMEMYNEANINDKQWDKIIPESTIEAWRNAYATGNYGPYNDYFPEIDWWDETVKKVALQQTYNINVRGGSEKIRYFASLGYLSDGDIYKSEKQPDYDPSFDYKRFNWRFNMDYDLTQTTSISLNIAGIVGNRNQPVFQSNSEPPDKYYFEPTLTAPTNAFPIKYSDGYWGETTSGRENLIANMLTGGQNKYKSFQGFYDFTLKQDLSFITPGLSIKGTISYTSTSNSTSRIINHGAFGANTTNGPKNEIRYAREYDYSNPIVNPDGTISYPLSYETRFPDATTSEDIPVSAAYDMFTGYSRRLYYEFSLNYNASFNGHNVTALALFLRRKNESTGGSAMEFARYEEDWVGRVTYNWKERYLLELNGSYTGSEKFAPGKRFGFFPSFSVGWRVTEEPWMKWKPLNNLKFRYSYGKVGNDLGANRFTYIQLYDSGGNATFGLNQNVNFGPLYTEGRVANPEATWEETTKQNLGIELGLFHKLNITLDLFKEHRTKILMPRQTMAAWFGASLPSLNLGEAKNHGFELEVDWQDKIGKNFRYWAEFNIASSENRILFRDDPYDLADYLKYAGKPVGVENRFLATGNYTSLDDIYNGPITNINGATQGMLIPGDLYYMDYNGDGIINVNDKVPLGKLSYPLTTCSLSLGFTYKNFSFNALLYAVPGIYRKIMTMLFWDFPGSNIKAQPHTLSRWTPEDAGAEGAVRPSVHISNAHNNASSTFTFTDHSYLRLKNIEVSYDLPKQILQKIYISRCQVYVNANNLFTITNADPRRDPERESASVYPIVKRYNIGLRLSF